MLTITCERPLLVVRFPDMRNMVSWAVNRPGFVRARDVAWLEVGNAELEHEADPVAWFERMLARRGLGDAVSLMTARDVSRYAHVSSRVENIRADCVITLGLNNGEHIGRRARPEMHPLNAGTINILCAVSVPLSQAASLEAMSVATQARTVALLETGYQRPEHEGVVTGTGTDCIVISAPDQPEPHMFAGMHTAIGEAIGRSVYRATLDAARKWRAERG